jgi:predicted esterase
MRCAGLAVTCAGFLSLAGGWGQPESLAQPASAPAAAAAPPTEAKARTTVTDLARAYLELEAAFFAAPVERELCREVNTAFDEASMLFFAGNLARVVEIVDANTAKLRDASKLPKPTPPDLAPVIEADFWSMSGDTTDEEPERPARPLAIWNARRDLLASASVVGSVESLVADSASLHTSLIMEAKSIAKGENPYTHHRGDIWRPYFISDQPAPMRLFCPEHREPPAAGWPLVIALHGAGGNEHMFMAAYGVGRIKKLAEQHGFVVASPLNSPLAAQPVVFDALINSVAADYPIDRTRVYLIGHSMGAGVALAWSKLRTEKVAASALIAGIGRFNPKDKLPPTLLIAPELDGLIPARSIIASAEQAKGFGLPVECREIKDYGHTLVVGHILPDVVEWLLSQPPAEAASAVPPATKQPATPGAAP